MLKVAMAHGRSRAAAKYWIRYQSDAAFRAAEIARVRARKHLLAARRARPGSLSLQDERRLRTTATTCRYCGEPLTAANRTLDHIIPLSRGGKHIRRNVVPCCRRCNSRKGQRLKYARRDATTRARRA
ncbi:MAG: HNH endonuclease [Gemmatimonadetes bacterium]|nr:HNH endonuclease [Gemmatimonadota bacterium]